LLCGGFDVYHFSMGYRVFLTDAFYGLRTVDLIIPATYNTTGFIIGQIYNNNLNNDPAFAGQHLPDDLIWLGVQWVSTISDWYF